MPKILFDDNHITKHEILAYRSLIEDILSGRLHSPKIKKLEGAKYQSEDVFRAKLDKKNRLIFTYVPHEGKRTLLILAANDHNYGKVKRQLGATNAPTPQGMELIEEVQMTVDAPDSTPLSFIPTVSYNQMTLALDDAQQQGLQLSPPLVLSGPPGAGKTALLYNMMLRNLDNIFAQSNNNNNNAPQAAPVLFISQSEHLVNTLRTLYNSTMQSAVPVQFTTWQGLLKSQNAHLTPVTEAEFTQWLEQNWPGQSGDMVHYEFSLIAALGTEKYLKLGNRQCYYSGLPEQQKKLINLLANWQQHLITKKLFDPMVTRLNPAQQKYAGVFCDEAQNFPPTALSDLIQHTEEQRFVACLDSEQCLISSPYIHSCLKELLYHHYKEYNEHPLPRTWRCPPKVAEVANHLMETKYALDGGGKRRNYKTIASAHESGGLVSWIDEEGLPNIHHHGASAGTVVIAEHLEPGDREFINQHLGTNNILTAKDAIGLDFDVVILWNPLSHKKCLQDLRKKNHDSLSLEQWNALNALYVALTRAQSTVFIYETGSRWLGLGEQLLGKLPRNETSPHQKEATHAQELKKWNQTVEHHLAEGRFDIAREIMKFHLKMDAKTIEEKISASRPLPIPPVKPVETVQSTKDEPKKKKKIKQSSASATEHSGSQKQNESKLTNKIPMAKSNKEEEQLPKVASANNHQRETKPEDAKPNIYDTYITGLLNRLDDRNLHEDPEVAKKIKEENLKKLFTHSKVIYFLFHHQLKDGSYLFMKLLSKHVWNYFIFDWFYILIELLSTNLNPKLLSQPFASSPDETLLYWLSTVSKGHDLLLALLIKNPYFAQGINSEDLYGRRSSIYGKTSPFFWLTFQESGITVLNELFAQNPELAKGLSAETLKFKTVIPGSSPLYRLASNPNGPKLLRKLLDINPEIAKNLSVEDLCEKNEEDKSVLDYLFDNSSGFTVLAKLLTVNPELAKEITEHEAYNISKTDQDRNTHESATFDLSHEKKRNLVPLFENILALIGVPGTLESSPRPSQAGFFSPQASTSNNTTVVHDKLSSASFEIG